MSTCTLASKTNASQFCADWQEMEAAHRATADSTPMKRPDRSRWECRMTAVGRSLPIGPRSAQRPSGGGRRSAGGMEQSPIALNKTARRYIRGRPYRWRRDGGDPALGRTLTEIHYESASARAALLLPGQRDVRTIGRPEFHSVAQSPRVTPRRIGSACVAQPLLAPLTSMATKPACSICSPRRLATIRAIKSKRSASA